MSKEIELSFVIPVYNGSKSIGHRTGWHEIDRLYWRAWATGRQHKILVLKLDSQESP